MNYFAHSFAIPSAPYLIAGVAVPDWLTVADRAVRVRPAAASPFLADADPATMALARGIMQHHADDDWFHQTPAFLQVMAQLAKALRAHLSDDSPRPGFLGHILTEMLLDAALIEQFPQRLSLYYAALDQVDGEQVQAAVNRMAPKSTDRLSRVIDGFRELKFLWDYREDAGLLYRVNQVLGRVKLPALPESVLELLPELRMLVKRQQHALLSGFSQLAVG